MAEELWKASAVELAAGIRDRRFSCKDLFDASIYSYGINYLGLPAGVVPIDLVENLPAGVQLVGRRFREDVILDAMAAIGQRAGRLVDRLWTQV